MWKNLPLFPERASAMAWQVDGLYFLLIAVSAFFTLLIFALILVFSIKYRRSVHPHAVPIEGSLPLELTWTLIPLGICMIFFAWGSLIYFQEARPPKGAMEVYTVGKQWMWKFEHETGQREINQLHVPVGRDVEMVMSSQDVIHSFFVPAFRVKADVLPGRYTMIWFRATKPGTYDLFCSQYCGTQHSGMIGKVIVMDPTAYQAWLSGETPTGTLASNGQQLFQQLGCSTCHRSDTQGRGPNLIGVFGKPVLLDDGRTVTADENYIRESILNPGAKIVSGFKPIMPSFQGQVSEESLMALVAYVKSLGQPQQGEPAK
jgi:cytochrome c oxidase subunit II